MNRLTFEGNFCDLSMCRENPCPYNGACSQRKVWERLKEYENREEQEGKGTNVPTNADRIRAMSDEELAVMFAMLRADLSRLDAAVRPYSGRDVNDNYDWLQQPCEGGADDADE